MINHYRNIQVSSIVFIINFLITTIIGIFLVPIYLNEIGIEIYGAWLVLTSILQIFSSLDPGFATVFEQRFSILFSKKDNNTLSVTLLLAIIMMVVLVIIIFLVGWVGYPFMIKFSNLTEYSIRLRLPFFISLIGTALLIGSYGLNAIVNGLQKIIYISFLQLFTNLVGLVTLLILIYKDFGVLSLAMSIFIRGFLSFIFPFLYLLNKYYKFNVKSSDYFQQFKLLAKLFTFTSVSRFLGVLVMNLDLTLISKFYNTNEVNIVAFTKKIPSFIFNAVDIPVNSILPTISYLTSDDTINNNKLRNIVTNVISIYTRTILVLAVYFVFFNDMIIRIWLSNDSLIASQLLNLLIIFGIVVSSFGHLIVKIATTLGFVTKISKIIILQNFLMLPSLYFFTKYFGLLGLLGTPILLISIFSIFIPGILLLNYFSIKRYSSLLWIWNNLKIILPVLGLFWFYKYYFIKLDLNEYRILFELISSFIYFVIIFLITLKFYRKKVNTLKILLSD